MSNACRVSLCRPPYSLFNCFVLLVRLNTRTGISELNDARTSVGSIPLFVVESLMWFNIMNSHDGFARKVISIAHFANEILLCSKNELPI